MPKPTDIIPEITADMSPMMRQYVQIKSQYPDSILMFRLGDFYEMFYNDAQVASDELDLVLTRRANGEEEKAPMCGVPYHSCESYIARLIKKGYRVAICEQTEDPAKTKKLVRREVIRVITPGTVTEESMLDAAQNNYLATVFSDGKSAGICFVDISTGELHLTEKTGRQLEAQIISDLTRFAPKELLLNKKAAAFEELRRLADVSLRCRVDVLDDDSFYNEQSIECTRAHFKTDDLSSIGVDENSTCSKALCKALQFLNDTQKNDLSAIRDVDIYSDDRYMRLDISTRSNLELTETLRTHEKKGSLLWVLDYTKTPMGKRLIRNWIELPLLSAAKITRRQNAVAELVSKHEVREELSSALREIKDIERLITRILYGSANAKELVALAVTLDKMPYVKAAINNSNSSLLTEIYNDIDELYELSALIKNAIIDDPPLSVREGWIIRDGYNEQVDKLRADLTGGKDIVADMELSEQKRTGVKKLRIRYNRVFGYYIEIPNSADFTPPDDYVRRQTLTNCERYSTPAVKELENRIFGAQDKLIALEYDIFVGIRNTAAQHTDQIKKTAAAVARLDALWSLSMAAYNNNYICPDISVDGKLEITEGRHPVVELLSNEAFVPNDVMLDPVENRCAIITGPNMAGKSTYMRQTALIALMAQIGSFVPARAAKCCILDAIYTRVGASDDLASGQSTFMVEMSEVANILKYATKNSLLIIDEIGRGTSTYDGMAIARAVLEYVADRKKVGAKTLFATHYHELTVLEQNIDGVKNYNIAAKKRGDNIIFLRRIVRGGADDSYGVEVASLAGVPKEVIARAKEILAALEKDMPKIRYSDTMNDGDQTSIAANLAESLVEQLALVDVNSLSPVQALQRLDELVNKARQI